MYLYVPRKNVHSKDGGSWIGILYENIKQYLHVVSRTYRLQYITLVIAVEQNNLVILSILSTLSSYL